MTTDIQRLRKQWLDAALAPYVDDEECVAYFTKLLKRCNAKTHVTFLRWFRLNANRSPFGLDEPEAPPLVVPPRAMNYFVHEGVLNVVIGEHEGESILWRLPEGKLEWVRSVWPVFAKRLAPLELPERKALRELKAQFKRAHKSWYGCSPFSREQFERAIADLEAQLVEAEKKPQPPRFAIWKSRNGSSVPLQRGVAAIDGDLLNYCDVLIRRERRRLSPESGPVDLDKIQPHQVSERWVPNIYVVGGKDDPNQDRVERSQKYHAEQQLQFEDKLLRMPQWRTADGAWRDVDFPAKNTDWAGTPFAADTPWTPARKTVSDEHTPLSGGRPNADLGKRSGYYGEVADAGDFEAPAPEDQYTPSRRRGSPFIKRQSGFRRLGALNQGQMQGFTDELFLK